MICLHILELNEFYLFTKSPQLFKDTINLDAYIKSSLGFIATPF